MYIESLQNDLWPPVNYGLTKSCFVNIHIWGDTDRSEPLSFLRSHGRVISIASEIVSFNIHRYVNSWTWWRGIDEFNVFLFFFYQEKSKNLYFNKENIYRKIFFSDIYFLSEIISIEFFFIFVIITILIFKESLLHIFIKKISEKSKKFRF